METDWPGECQSCFKATISVPHRKCDLCKELSFPEQILCDLNRATQTPSSFRCCAVRSKLRSVDSDDSKRSDLQNELSSYSQSKDIRTLLISDRIKYEKALFLQKLRRDPDEMFVSIKYHLALSTLHRKPIFDLIGDAKELISGIFSEYSVQSGEQPSLLWLAPDHVHIHVESDGNRSVEEISEEIKRLSSTAILKQFADVEDIAELGDSIWDISCFVETLC